MKVSVIIPSHNRQAFIEQTVASALNQQEVSTEVIVVDDASTDGTLGVLETFGTSIKVIALKEGVERGAARNIGAATATSNFLAFLDSDDLWKPQKLSTQVQRAGTETASVTGVEFLAGDHSIVRTYIPPAQPTRTLLRRNPYLAGPSSLLIPRELFQRLGGFPEERSVQGTEDWLFFFKLWKAGNPVHVVPTPLVSYRVHNENFTGDPDAVARCMWATPNWLLERKLISESEARRMKGHVATVIGRHYTARSRWSEALHWAKVAFSDGSSYEALIGGLVMLGSAAKAASRSSGGDS